MDTSSKVKRFLRNTSPLLTVMLFLAFINILTSDFPWALFPIGAMMIPVLIMAANIFLAEDKPDEADVNARRAARTTRDVAQSAGSSDSLRSAETASRLAQTQTYKRQIDGLVNSTSDPLRKDKLRELSNQVSEWTVEVEAMSRRVDDFKRNEVIQRDLVNVPQSIRKLTTQLSNEPDPQVKASLERTLAARADQMKSLQKLQSLTRQAEIQLESTIAALGTIYSQALAMQSTNQVADYGHLTTEVDEQSRMLKDQLEALEEVKLDRSQANLSQ